MAVQIASCLSYSPRCPTSRFAHGCELLLAESDAHYPLQSGIRDIIAYYYAGSLTERDARIGW